MDDYIGWLLDLTHWHWLAIGVALGGVEMLSMSFFLIFPAISTGFVALAVYIEPGIDWRLQLLLFAVLSIVSTVIGRSWLRRRRSGAAPMTVNVRGQTYAGRKVRLPEALEHGEGRIQIDDTWWHAVSPRRQTIPADTLVEITRADGATLQVRAVEDGRDAPPG